MGDSPSTWTTPGYGLATPAHARVFGRRYATAVASTAAATMSASSTAAAAAACNITLLKSTCCPGGGAAHTEGSTAAKCQAVCCAAGSCLAFTFNNKTGMARCYVKTSVGFHCNTHSADCTSGTTGAAPGPPPPPPPPPVANATTMVLYNLAVDPFEQHDVQVKDI